MGAPPRSEATTFTAAVPSLEAPSVSIIEPGTTCDAAAADIPHDDLTLTASETAEAVEPLVEYAADTDSETAVVEGRMYHDGINKNAWGMTEDGARAIADDLVREDFTASHPFIRGGRYDRAIADGPGRPIGSVLQTTVTTIDQAALSGGSYSADYIAGVTDPEYVTRYATGNLTGDGYAVSIGIYGDRDSATCNICGETWSDDDHDHRRGEKVVKETSDGEEQELMAGPLFNDGESDHLAAVYIPAYEDATASVDIDADASEASTVAAGASSDGRGGERPSLLAATFPDPVTDDADVAAAEATGEATASDTDPESEPESEPATAGSLFDTYLR